VSTRVEQAAWMPGWASWMTLVALIAIGMTTNWWVATGLLVVFLRQVARPFEFLSSYLLVTLAAAFIRYEAGELTIELSLLSGLILFMLASYAVSQPDRLLTLPRTKLLLPLLVYVGLSLANYVRGLLAGYSAKFASLELLPVLALATAPLVANGFDFRRHLKPVAVAVLALGLASAGLGYAFFAVYHVRTGGIQYTPVPGIAAMMAINLALRSGRPLPSVGWTFVAVALLVHQFISFTRGIWLGCIAGLLACALLYAWRGDRTAHRLRRVGLVYASLLGLGLVGAVGLGLALGQTDFLALAGSRFGSIGGTEFTHQNASKVVRFAEYAEVISHIAVSPWLGHGLGYTFSFREPIGFTVIEQWYSHQIYLFIWLKQGIVGLAAFVWMLFTAVAMGARGSRRHDDPWESAWLATSAAATVLVAVTDLSNFQLGGVHVTFPLALLWGGAIAISREGLIRFRWAPASAAPPRAGVEA